MARHLEPEFVTEWKKREIPKCCHTCDWYSKQGVCQFHQSEPPEDFAKEVNSCNDWIEEIPF
jgi:sulfatase maturation enzyme AslB (radical SAM superfamily)